MATAMMVPCEERAVSADEVKLDVVQKQFGPPVLGVTQPQHPPVVDGPLDDAAWSAIEALTLKAAEGGWTSPSQRTEARVLADKRAIYFAVRCFEESPDKLRSAELDK